MARGGYTYIITNKPRGVLYIGVTADLAEVHDDITWAIAREKALKAWKREWKIRLIEDSNSDWRDIADLIL